MGVQIADADLADRPFAHEALEAPLPIDDDRLSAARGIMLAALLSLPFWALIAFTVYLVL